METRETPTILENAKASAVRSADFWSQSNPSLSVALLTFVNHYDKLIAEHEGEFVLITGDGKIEGTFENEEEALKFSDINLQGKKKGIIHPISSAGISSSQVYKSLVPKEIWDKYLRAGSKATIGLSTPVNLEFVEDVKSTKPS